MNCFSCRSKSLRRSRNKSLSSNRGSTRKSRPSIEKYPRHYGVNGRNRLNTKCQTDLTKINTWFNKCIGHDSTGNHQCKITNGPNCPNNIPYMTSSNNSQNNEISFTKIRRNNNNTISNIPENNLQCSNDGDYLVNLGRKHYATTKDRPTVLNQRCYGHHIDNKEPRLLNVKMGDYIYKDILSTNECQKLYNIPCTTTNTNNNNTNNNRYHMIT